MMRPPSVRLVTISALLVLGAAVFGHSQPVQGPARDDAIRGEPRWLKGNLHTHTMWSDGDDFPEMVAAWYKSHGYHFLALSDHNVLSEGERWVDAEKHANGAVVRAIPKYREQFGAWVEERQTENRPEVRLKPLDEFKALLDEPGRFLLIQSEEITDKFNNLPVHLNATNLRDRIAPTGGESVVDVLQKNVNAVLQQRRQTKRPMFVHVNHPNYGWALKPEDLIPVKGERFFEVFNGHPGVRNYGDKDHTGTDRMWDLILAGRLTQANGEVMYGLGTDDAHNYHEFGGTKVNPGRGWVMVRARHLTAESIVGAMERGDFYASTGVRLQDLGSDGRRVWLRIDADPGVTYETEFIGSLRPDGNASTPGAVSDTIGRVLAKTTDLNAAYEMTGRELYVRARVRSSRPHPNPYANGDFETAWTQPTVPQ